MSTLQQLREEISESWENIQHGWRQLFNKASGALTRFIPLKKDENEESNITSIKSPGTGWGLIAADLFDDNDKIVVKLEAPGMKAEDFDIQIREDVLVVRGEKRFQREQTKGRYHLMECAYGRFERAIPLPASVDDTRAEATYRDGLLHIVLPRSGKSEHRRIRINTA